MTNYKTYKIHLKCKCRPELEPMVTRLYKIETMERSMILIDRSKDEVKKFVKSLFRTNDKKIKWEITKIDII